MWGFLFIIWVCGFSKHGHIFWFQFRVLFTCRKFEIFNKGLIVYFVNSSFSYISFDGSWFVTLSREKSTIL